MASNAGVLLMPLSSSCKYLSTTSSLHPIRIYILLVVSIWFCTKFTRQIMRINYRGVFLHNYITRLYNRISDTENKYFPVAQKGQELIFLFFPLAIFFRWELVGPVSHCRAGAGVAVCSCLSSQIRDVGQGSSNVVDCMWALLPPPNSRGMILREALRSF